MKKLIFFVLGMMFILDSSFGQKIITLQSGTTVSLYYSIDSAIAHAISGDQIYIPGGTFSVTNIYVNKSVLIFGAGHCPDSTLATGPTILSGNIFLVNGSSGGLITGCNITGDITVGTSTANDSVSNYSISRCNFGSLYFSSTGISPTHARGFSVNENVIRGSILGADATNINFSKNIIQGGVKNFNGTTSFVNNDFIGLGNCLSLINFLNSVSSCTFENNVILFSPPVCTGAAFFGGACDNNTFTNNLFKEAITFPQGTNTGFNSIIGQPVASTFTNALGDIFNYTDNYHLLLTSPGIHAGTDGTDIGVYGTATPFKEGSVPFNPHIRQKNISTSTDPQGQLNIMIRVAAQDN